MSAVLYSLRDGRLKAGGRVLLRAGTVQFRILTALLAARGKWVSVDDLIYQTWIGLDLEEPEYAEGCMTRHICYLRKKLAGTDITILNCHGWGYRAFVTRTEALAA